MDIISIVDEGFGHSSYVVGFDDGSALVIDPARFPTAQRATAQAHGWKIRWTADTHSHADYISGSPTLAVEGAEFLASRGARLESPHRPLDSGDVVALSPGVSLRAISTPGHTPDHLSYLLEEEGLAVALFSGGSLMVGAVGRTDLLGADRRDGLTRQLFHALRDDILTLPDDVAVYPTHGAGSFCSAPPGADRTSTIGRERATNPLLAIEDEDEFVEAVTSTLGSFPSYFAELPELNRRGRITSGDAASVAPDALPRLGADAVADAVEQGAVLVDTRPIADFARGHPVDAVSIAHRAVFGTWLGWLVPREQAVVLVVDDTTDRSDLVRQSLTIGHDRLLGELDGGVEAWRAAGFEVTAIPLVDATHVAPRVLDVRQDNEWSAGHVPGADHVELGSVLEMPAPSEALTVMCGHGERAMTAASMIAPHTGAPLSVLAGGPEDLAGATRTPLVTGA